MDSTPNPLQQLQSKEVSSKKDMCQTKDQIMVNTQKPYPKGQRHKVINKMTRISNKEMMDFNQCKCWREIVQFHRKNTPWLGDTQINEIINIYKMQAQGLKDKGILEPQNQWKLNDL